MWEKELRRSIRSIVKEVLASSKLLDQEISRNELPAEEKICKIGAVDGGSQRYDFTAVSIIFVQSAGGIFIQNRKPTWYEFKKIHSTSATRNLSRYEAIYRDTLELKAAKALLNKNPDVILLDGVHGSYLSRGFPLGLWRRLQDQNGELYPDQAGYVYLEAFDDFFKEYNDLIKTCIEKDVLLLGVAKDSRYTRLVRSLNLPHLIGYTDPTLVKWNFQGKLGYTDPISTQPPIDSISLLRWRKRKFASLTTDCYTSYFLLSADSIPFRVDIMSEQIHRIEEIARIFMAYHDGQGFLLPPFLAHQKAHARRLEMEHWSNLIRRIILEESPELFDLLFKSQRRDLF